MVDCCKLCFSCLAAQYCSVSASRAADQTKKPAGHAHQPQEMQHVKSPADPEWLWKQQQHVVGRLLPAVLSQTMMPRLHSALLFLHQEMQLMSKSAAQQTCKPTLKDADHVKNSNTSMQSNNNISTTQCWHGVHMHMQATTLSKRPCNPTSRCRPRWE